MQQRAASIKAQRCVEHGEYHCKDCASLRLASQSKEFIKGARGAGGMFSGSADFEQSLESFHSEADLAAERGEGAKADAKEYLARLGEQEKASRGKGGCLRCGLPDCEGAYCCLSSHAPCACLCPRAPGSSSCCC